MIQLRNFLKLNIHILFGVWIIFIGTILKFNSKLELHQTINQWCFKEADSFFEYYTFLGDGIFMLIIIILSLFFKFKNSILLLATFILSGSITQYLKNFPFKDEARPFIYFKDNPSFHLIDGFDYHLSMSFPSGHATSIFAICTMICLIYPTNKLIQITGIIISITVSFSRVYLSQHFLLDIYVGSMIGYFSSIFIFQIFKNSFEFKKANLLDFFNNK